jgi:hypothetical protein
MQMWPGLEAVQHTFPLLEGDLICHDGRDPQPERKRGTAAGNLKIIAKLINDLQTYQTQGGDTMAFDGMSRFLSLTKNERRVATLVLIFFAIFVLTASSVTKPIQKNVTVENETSSQLKLELEHVERGDIVWFGEHDYQMVFSQSGGIIFFKIPTVQGMAMSMEIGLVARQAKDVIKYHPTSVVWNNAVFILTTGSDPPSSTPPK